MKRLLLAATVLVALLTASWRLAPGTMSPDERKFAINYYEKTKARLLNDLNGLSEAQLNFKADTGHWSIYECTEHIALSENMIWQWIQMTEKQPATPDKRSEVKYTTDQVMNMVTDRSHKVKTIPPLEPEKKFPNTKAALDAYIARRDSTIYYIRSTQDDLKNHFIQAPGLGTMDLYQGLVFLAAHSERHTKQIEELMADPNFPKQ